MPVKRKSRQQNMLQAVVNGEASLSDAADCYMAVTALVDYPSVCSAKNRWQSNASCDLVELANGSFISRDERHHFLQENNETHIFQLQCFIFCVKVLYVMIDN